VNLCLHCILIDLHLPPHSVVKQVNKQHPHLSRALPWGRFGEYRVLNLCVTDKIHCDPLDAGLTMISIFTEQSPHYLCLPELGVKVLITNGSVVALASAYLYHFVEQAQNLGIRFSYLFTSRVRTVDRLKVQRADLC
jgi:hypothetical protein